MVSGARVQEQHGGVREGLVLRQDRVGVAVLRDSDRVELFLTTQLKELLADRRPDLVTVRPLASPLRSRFLSTEQDEQHLHPGASHEREGESLTCGS